MKNRNLFVNKILTLLETEHRLDRLVTEFKTWYCLSKYSLNKSNKSGDLLTYHCSTKHITKCSAKCQVAILTFENNEKKFVLTKFSDLASHNHETSEGEILVNEMVAEMEKRYMVNLTEKPVQSVKK